MSVRQAWMIPVGYRRPTQELLGTFAVISLRLLRCEIVVFDHRHLFKHCRAIGRSDGPKTILPEMIKDIVWEPKRPPDSEPPPNVPRNPAQGSYRNHKKVPKVPHRQPPHQTNSGAKVLKVPNQRENVIHSQK